MVTAINKTKNLLLLLMPMGISLADIGFQELMRLIFILMM